MALCISIPSFSDSATAPSLSQTYFSLSRRRPSNFIHFLNLSLPNRPPRLCRASNSQPGPFPKQSASASSKKRKKKDKGDSKVFNPTHIEVVDDFSFDDAGPSSSTSNSTYSSYHPSTLPKPPAGFVLDDHGKVLMASNKRIATMVDPLNNLPLECVIRRIFRSSKGDDCMLLCPVDTPVQILKSKNIDGWSAVSDDEVESLLPAAAYALAKIHMHLVHSGFCYTARGAFCYSEDDIFDFRTDDGQDVDGLPNEGVEITCFHMDKLGQLTIADDELLEDPAIISAIDEETEFNALVEEEAALLESVLGKE
ncbi:uncharacterized protein LOC101207357 isoform X2 [Cucumis sativus]|uniref:uncharacterized protein LOC101207357 isoform X2 n=1 Tax=Cucumis sativus TaxID=3659 RepID=UPI0005EC2F81|nr:uncharacterized protein LOC101207357 isoform X2 [Cucumis sativus]